MHSRTLALTIAGGAAGAVSVALLRMRRPGVLSPGRSTAEPRSETQEHRCECGQAFRVAGIGRHRVFWLAGAAEGDPVLSGTCPSCERPLPRDHDAA